MRQSFDQKLGSRCFEASLPLLCLLRNKPYFSVSLSTLHSALASYYRGPELNARGVVTQARNTTSPHP